MNAPIVLFVYKRPQHTRRTLESLLRNPEARDTPLYVFSDGPRALADAPEVAATRAEVRALDHPDVRLFERPANLGLARSVIAGVSQVCGEHGTAIVLEDDLVLAPTFLSFMNAALERYRDEEKAYGISGYAYTDVSDLGVEAAFLPLIGSWGWATWERAWKNFQPSAEESLAALRANASLRRSFDVGGYRFFNMLRAQQRGEVDSWAIRWYASAFLKQGLTLYPARSLVTNIGFDGTGVHCGPDTPAMAKGNATASRIERFPDVAVNEEALRRVAKTLHESSRHTPVRTTIRLLKRYVKSVLQR